MKWGSFLWDRGSIILDLEVEFFDVYWICWYLICWRRIWNNVCNGEMVLWYVCIGSGANVVNRVWSNGESNKFKKNFKLKCRVHFFLFLLVSKDHDLKKKIWVQFILDLVIKVFIIVSWSNFCNGKKVGTCFSGVCKCYNFWFFSCKSCQFILF